MIWRLATGALLLALLLFVPPPLRAGVLQQAPPGQVVEGLDLDPVVARAGEPVAVTFRVSNTGASSLTYNVPVLVDGVLETQVTGELPSGGSRGYLVPVVRLEEAVYQVQVEEEMATFIVSPASFSVSSLQIFPSLVGPGDAVEVVGRVTNTGGVPGTYHKTLKVSGLSRGERTGVLPPGAVAPLLFSIVAGQPGTHAVSLGGAVTSLTVLPPLAAVDIVDLFPVAPQTTTAQDDRAQSVPLTGDHLRLSTAAGSLPVATFPVALEPGRTLVQFQDLATGVSYLDGVLELPLPVEELRADVSLIAQVTPPTGSGDAAVVTLENSVLHLEGMDVDQGAAEPGLGPVSLELDLTLDKVSLGSTLDLRARKVLSPAMRERINGLTQVKGERIGGVALVLDLTDRAAGQTVAVKGGTIRFSLGAPWVDRYGSASAVRVAWIGGVAPQILRALPKELDSRGQLWFEAALPPGLASLAILVLITATDLDAMIQDLVLAPPAAVPGDVVVVTGKVANDGASSLVAPITLTVDGVPRRTRSMILGPGESNTMSFLVAVPDAGSYTIGLNGRYAVVQVAPPLDPLVVKAADLRVSAAEAVVESPVLVSLQVTNTGGSLGLAHLLLRLNGALSRGLPVVLGPGESKRVEAVIAFTHLGSYEVEVGGLKASIAVIPPPMTAPFQVSAMVATPRVVDPGQPVTIAFKVTNQSNLPESFQGVLEVEQDSQPVGPFLVPERTTLPFETQVTLFTPGHHTLKLGGEEAVLVVRDAVRATFRVTNLRIEPQNVRRGRPILVKAVITNTDESLGVDEVTLKVDGHIASTEWTWLGPGVSREVEFTVEENDLGKHTLELNGARSEFIVKRIVSLATIAGLVSGGVLLAATGAFAVWLQRRGRLRAA